jgi:hypothetical protein
MVLAEVGFRADIDSAGLAYTFRALGRRTEDEWKEIDGGKEEECGD